MPPEINPDSPVPLYHQIAEAIRAQMARGELQAGDALAPMRKAAERWSVNLHTVRHAYAALAREGLLEMQSARGTRVTERAKRLQLGEREPVAVFVERVVREADQKHGLSAGAFASLIAARAGEKRPQVAVVECSSWQCAAHASELEADWEVDAQAWPLSRESEPQGDAVVATYFHYNDIRARWPHLLSQVRFLTIHVDPRVATWLNGAQTAAVLEWDEPTAQAVAADLQVALAGEIELLPVVTEDPSTLLEKNSNERVLCSPRVWSELAPELRRDERFAVVHYKFDEAELQALARELGWRPVEVGMEVS